MTAPSLLSFSTVPLPYLPTHPACSHCRDQALATHSLHLKQRLPLQARFLLRRHLLLRVPLTHPYLKLPTPDSHLGIPYPHLTFYLFYLNVWFVSLC